MKDLVLIKRAKENLLALGFTHDEIKSEMFRPVERKPKAQGEIHIPIKDILHIQKEIRGKTNFTLGIAAVSIIMAKIYCRTMGVRDLEKTEFGVNLSKDDYAIVHYREYK